MIIVGGTNLSAESLPLAEVVKYQLESSEDILGIKLKTVARHRGCIGIYLHDTFKGKFQMSSDVESKITYFSTDKDLLRLLDNGGLDVEEEVVVQPEPVREDIEVMNKPKIESKIVFEDRDTHTNLNKAGFMLEDIPNIEEELYSLPVLDESITANHAKIEQQEDIIRQLKAQIKEANERNNELCDMQEIQLLEAKEKYDTLVKENNERIIKLKKLAEESKIPDDKRYILKFDTYATKFRSKLQEGFSKEDTQELTKKTKNLYVLASGSGESTYKMLSKVRGLIASNPNAVFVDFTGDPYLRSAFKLSTNVGSLALDGEAEVSHLVREVGGVDFVMTNIYNDIALLRLNWVRVISKLVEYAGNRKIVLLFGSIDSFSVGFTVSKIATVASSTAIFTYASPPVLYATYSRLSFIPNGRFRLVVLEYISDFKGVLDSFGKNYTVYATEKDVRWEKLKMDF